MSKNRLIEDKFTEIVGRSSIDRAYHLLVGPRLKYTKKILKNPGKVLDAGCGGGNMFLINNKVCGIDLSTKALINAKNVYKNVSRGDVSVLPFKDDSFDFIISWDVFGHIPMEKKDKTLNELKRVLKKKGKIGMFVETDGMNRLSMFAKKYPKLYKKHFIEEDGHIGLEIPSKVLERFEKNGLKITLMKQLYTNPLVYTSEFIKRFDNEYKNKSVIIKLFIDFSLFLKKTRMNYFLDFFLEFMGRLLDNFSSLDSANSIFVCCEK